jgi:hypothetical protein
VASTAWANRWISFRKNGSEGIVDWQQWSGVSVAKEVFDMTEAEKLDLEIKKT